MGFVQEFKEFALKGNVIDLAVGVIIGGAFGKIVTSLVEDVVNPLIGMVIGKVNFANLFINLSGKNLKSYDEAKKAGEAVVGYGVFLNTAVQFLIMAFIVFLMVKAINNLKRSASVAAAVPAEPPREEVLLTEIRDLLKQRS
jgi:large conductance mechanosensitive channel